MQILNHELFDDLKGCGNCKHCHLADDCYHEYHTCDKQDRYKEITYNKLCRHWEHDNLKKSDRWIEVE